MPPQGLCHSAYPMSLLPLLFTIAQASQMTATHYWDCSGAACDSRTLQPWNSDRYRYAPQYAPLDPEQHGGALYGETLWLTGAASDTLSGLLGSDEAGCCGVDPDGGGGCGKCVLITNPSAVDSARKAVVIKKNRCPPENAACAVGKAHMDIAVPGYDVLQYSFANICGQPGTFMTSQAQSESCGEWYNRGANTIEGCDCSLLPNTTLAQQILHAGCQRFTDWGWTSGYPTLEYEIVQCPSALESIIGAAFGVAGVIVPTAFPLYSPSPSPSMIQPSQPSHSPDATSAGTPTMEASITPPPSPSLSLSPSLTLSTSPSLSNGTITTTPPGQSGVDNMVWVWMGLNIGVMTALAGGAVVCRRRAIRRRRRGADRSQLVVKAVV